MACLGQLTIDHASLSRRSTVPAPTKRRLRRLGARYVFSMYYIEADCLSYLRPVSPSMAGGRGG